MTDTPITLDRFSLDNILVHAHAEVNRITRENMELRCKLEEMALVRDYAVSDMAKGTALVAEWRAEAEIAEGGLATARQAWTEIRPCFHYPDQFTIRHAPIIWEIHRMDAALKVDDGRSS